MHALACQTCGSPLRLSPATFATFVRCQVCRTVHELDASATMMIAEDAARIAMSDDSVLALLKQHFASADSMYFCPNVPTRTELAARKTHAAHLPAYEYILALYDDTVFGSGEEGFVITSQRVCWKNAGERPQMITWSNVDPDRLWCEDRKLYIGAGAIEIAGDASVIDACADAFHVLAFSARPTPHPPHVHVASGIAPAAPRATRSSAPPPSTDFKPTPMVATPPPAHHVSYHAYAVHSAMQPTPEFACWHCKTPLHSTTPQCSFCGAWPSAEGWLRTA